MTQSDIAMTRPQTGLRTASPLVSHASDSVTIVACGRDRDPALLSLGSCCSRPAAMVATAIAENLDRLRSTLQHHGAPATIDRTW